jgi:hypothetical protein
MYSQFSQQAYPITMSSTIDLTIKESQKNKMEKEDGLDKWLPWNKGRGHSRELAYMTI